jgi:hypothetical protein
MEKITRNNPHDIAIDRAKSYQGMDLNEANTRQKIIELLHDAHKAMLTRLAALVGG